MTYINDIEHALFIDIANYITYTHTYTHTHIYIYIYAFYEGIIDLSLLDDTHVYVFIYIYIYIYMC